MTSIKLAHANWDVKIGNLCQNVLFSANLWASAACNSGPITPPTEINGKRAKLEDLALADVLTSPIIVAIATRIELLMIPANARISAHTMIPSLKPMLRNSKYLILAISWDPHIRNAGH